MVTAELQELHRFTAELIAKLDACDNGEGMECATLDQSLHSYADTCCRFYERLRRWGGDVFSGAVPFDSEVELSWITEAHKLYSRAFAMCSLSQKAEGPCYTLEGQRALQAVLWQLHRLLTGWVTPKLSVGPSARNPLSKSGVDLAEVARRVAALPPLPADWEPEEPTQKAIFRKMSPQI
jgi:hypothetical protein